MFEERAAATAGFRTEDLREERIELAVVCAAEGTGRLEARLSISSITRRSRRPVRRLSKTTSALRTSRRNTWSSTSCPMKKVPVSLLRSRTSITADARGSRGCV